jgi:hypothetical protein
MGRPYASIDDAWQAFNAFARLEPQLTALWGLCRRAAPPAQRTESIVEPINDAYDDAYDDAYGVDPFEVDLLAADNPEAGWCAEDYFLDNVKSKLLALVGVHRVRGPDELQTTATYETVYDLLVNWALHRPCACCADPDDGPWLREDDGSPAHS